jgi:hypothetical protein
MRILLLVLIVGLALYSNPSFDKHKALVHLEIKEQTQEKTEANLASKLGQWLNRGVSQLAVDALMSYDNYYVASVTHLKTDSEERLLSIGVFGQVFILPQELSL